MQQKSAKWIWIFPICQAIFVLAFFIFILIPIEMPDTAAEATFIIFGLGLLCGLISAILAVVSHRSAALYNPIRERNIMLFIKLALIPFFILGSLVILFVAAAAFAMAPLFIVNFLLSALGYFVMLCGSAWAICYALSCRRINTINSGTATVLIIMQFFFVLDVIAAIILYVLGRRTEKVRMPVQMT